MDPLSLGKRENYDEYIMAGDAFNLPVYEKLQDHPVLRTDPKYAALKGEGVQFHTYGWPAPRRTKCSSSPTPIFFPT